MLCIKKTKFDEEVWSNLDGLLFIVVVGVDVFDFGEVMFDEFFGLMRAMNLPIVPEGREAFVVIGVIVGEKVDKGSPGEGFTEVEIVHDDVGVRDDPRHSLFNYR